MANVSLTNTTVTIKGMSLGGNSYAEPGFGIVEDENQYFYLFGCTSTVNIRSERSCESNR